MRHYFAVAAMLLVAACSNYVSNPVLTPPAPKPPEPLAFVDCTDHFVYARAGDSEPCTPKELDGYTTTVTLDKHIVTLTVPYGWEAYYAGTGAWVGLKKDSRARIIIYPVAVDAVRDKFLDDWYMGNLATRDATVKFRHWRKDSPEGPFLALYRRADDKLGVVYARTYVPARWNLKSSAAIVHGLWPTEYGNEFLPLALAVANSVKIIL